MPVAAVAGGVVAALFIGMAALAAVLGGAGSSLEVLGDEDATVLVDEFGGVALPEVPSELPDPAWSEPLDEDPLDIGAIGDVVYVTMGDFDPDRPSSPQLAAFDASSGERLWQRELDGYGGEVVVEAGERSVQLSAGQAFERNPDRPEPTLSVVTTEGEERWSRTYPEGSPSAVLLPGPQLLVRSPDADRSEFVELASGELMQEMDGWVVSRAGSHMVVSDEDERLVVVDDSGEELWSHRTRDASRAVASGGLVYVVEESIVWAYDASSGEQQWEVRMEDEVDRVQPLPDLGVLVRSSERTAAFDVDGEQLWRQRIEGAIEVHRSDGELVLLRIDEHDDFEPLELELIAAGTGQRLQQRAFAEDAAVYGEHGFPGLTVTGNAVLVYRNGELTAVSYDEFEDLWRFNSDGDAQLVGVSAIPGGLVAAQLDADGNGFLEGYR